MDRIKNLSLDQKAKLYYMALLQKGMIDTLPEDPKAAYISMMMDKDDYGRSVSGKDKRTFMEPEDMTMAARARKMAGMEPEDRATRADKMLSGEYEDEDYKDSERYADVRADLEDDEMETRYDYDDPIFENLKEIATELGYLNEEENYQNFPKPDRINLSYTDPGFRFYGMYLYKDGNRFAKISYEDRATKYLKNLGVNTEIPRSFDTDILDKIKQEIEALGIEGDYDAAMDVS